MHEEYADVGEGVSEDTNEANSAVRIEGGNVFVELDPDHPGFKDKEYRERRNEIAKIAIENNLWVLADDAYYEIKYDGKSRSIVEIPGMRDRTVILYTFSKKYAMTGWRVGWLIGPEKIIKIISKLNVNAESCTTHFIQDAMVEALNGDQSGPNEILRRLKKRRDVAVSGLNAIDGIEISTPEETFYLFPICL